MELQPKRIVIVRMAETLSEELFQLIFCRYPDNEWGCFVRFGIRVTPENLILTLQSIDYPVSGDLDETSWITEIQAQYTSRMLGLTETHPCAVGFVHSHPLSFGTGPSPSDYRMEQYYANLLIPYTSGLPFVSLIFALNEACDLSATGRVFWSGEWYEVEKFIIGNKSVTQYDYIRPNILSEEALKRVQRLASQFSIEAAQALAGATVGIVGASGTGSPCIELLARAGVGRLIIVDPEVFEDSNLERVHGSVLDDITGRTEKVLIAGRHVKAINPDCEVILIHGRIPQSEVVDQLVTCNLVLGCTDLNSARVALSDMALRYLIPTLDVGVVMEGSEGKITGQVVQINRFFPDDPCVYCRKMVDSRLVLQELMSPEEKEQRKAEAKKAEAQGREAAMYWIETPQLNTVGYLTTLAGGMVIGYAIGFLTGRFDLNVNRIELNLSRHGIQVVEMDENFDSDCTCSSHKGLSDQDPSAIMISAPQHWPQPIFLNVE
jgi:molybdopterin/thiamine biosynthesis adenylyltransferase